MKHGFECGLSFERYNDLKLGDVVEVFIVERIEAAGLTSARVPEPSSSWRRPGSRRAGSGAPCGHELDMHSRPERVGEEIREELTAIIAREVKDPGLGFITLTHVRMSARPAGRRGSTTRSWATRRRGARRRRPSSAPPRSCAATIAARVRLRRVPELHFTFDESVARGQRVEQLLQEIRPPHDPTMTTPPQTTSSR